jgi:peptide/nickel transport system permease protein
MGRFILRRFVGSAVVLFAVSVVTFLIFEAIPNGNPALRLAGRTATPANIAAVTKAYGFDRPLYIQYLKTMDQVFTGRIQSYTEHVNVLSQIRQDLPVTASLVLGAAAIWLIVGVSLGLIAGYRAGGKLDTAITVINFVGISAPSFVIGFILIFLLSFKAHVFPSGGYTGLAHPLKWADHLVMPWFCLAILYIGVYAQVLRANIIDTLNEDYVRTARAKGLSERQVRIHHVLRTSLIPVVSLSGLDIAAVLGGGAIIVETVFNLNGVGQYAGQSIGALDVPPVLTITMFGAFAVVIFSALVDVVYAALDPRIRLSNA